ncbi:SdrD B-like domain-containing protein [Aquabacterium sp. OR-4]|uniref:SdrD B-like domain-containing protein n=1 Tax=Aquabacterium sp. OR-4 TaxID=2978127 RepID=UPI0028C534BB|nr:SdrD B-like domain-containing protein [Aquabacterium sp. OR-4]MDT7837383.1 SdrD B-like domain-containing protein [Aquabacterium sp. OR-4]
MTTFTIRVSSSATNAAGTAYGQQPDLGAPSFMDLVVTNSTDPVLANGRYDGYCLNPLLPISVNTAYSATNGAGNDGASFTPIGFGSLSQNQVDRLNWLLSQNFTSDAKHGGQFNYGEVQVAIWKIVGFTDAQIAGAGLERFLSDNNRQVVNSADANFLVSASQAAVASGNGTVPTDAYFTQVIDPAGDIQPLIVQLQSAKIGNFVWNDDNANGVQDAGEAGVDQVIVQLFDGNGNLIASTLTGDDHSTAAVEQGYYQFAGLKAGNYQVKFVSATHDFTAQDANGNTQDAADSDANATTGLTSVIALAAGETNQTLDAGLVAKAQTASISGHVYFDANNDGQRAGDAGLAGVTVVLTGTNDQGQAVSVTATTDANGFYSFTGLRPGSYTVSESQPATYLDGQDTAGTGATAQMVSGNDAIAVTLAAGQSSVENNFGEILPASVSGTVYHDVNNDGSNAGETGIPGTTVTLTGTNDLGQPVSVTTTTDANGNYSFDGLRPGSYTVSETQPAGYLDGKDTAGTNGAAVTANDGISVTLGAGQSSTSNNFGEVKAASLAGNVFFDANNDGSRTGDTGIGGVTITLTGTNDLGQSVTLTTTTAADGSYKFDDLRPGTYSVNEGTVPAPYLDGKDTAGTVGGVTSGVAGNDVVNTVVLKSGDASIENNFGEIVPGTISGTVYHDVNNDGSNAGETGIPGTTVTLTGTNDLGQPVSVTTTTDANGNYSFDGLRPGSYTVSETQPAGYLDGKDTAGTNGAAVTANDGISVTLGAGQSSTSNNFGEVKAASLAGNVFFDANNDGSRTGDTGIGGVTITLTGTNDLGQSVTLTTTTAADGSYKFDDLRPGTYSVNEGTVPAPYLDGKDTAGTVGGVTSGVAGNDVVNTVVLKSGDASIENNFGEIVPGTISGTVYHDVNNDGSNAGETGIPGTTVTLTGTNDLGQPVSVTTTTDANGNYSFDGLRPGSYTVSETQPAGYLDGKDTAGTNGAAVTANDGISVTLGAGQSSTSNNFGEVKAASLAGNVFFDANNDGSRTGDTGIGGVTITLTGTNDLGQSVTLTTTTAADGSYKFDDLRPGTYSVNEGTVPAPYLDGKDTAGTVGGVTSGVAGNDVVNTVVLKSGDASIENNFGEIVPGTISGTVYHDVNNDGSNAGETGIPGTTVTLTGTNDLGQPVSVTTTTDANGNYSFDGLRPGSYTVSETQPAGYLDGKDTAGTNGAAVTANDGISVTLGAGQSSTSNNFGEVKAASLAGNVFFDANNDGSRTGDTGIGGVTITLTGTNDLGQSVTLTTTTAADGSYKFDDLRPGTYSVNEGTVPAPYLDGKDTAGTVGGVTSGVAGNDVVNTVVLKSGDASIENNFGEIVPGTISGTVYHDVNNDGSNAGETGIPGTTVTLTGTNDLGQPVSVTTTTDANGNYSFDGLRPGSYTVSETQPAGYLDGKDTAGTNGAAVTANDGISVTLGAGQSSTSNNFGEVKAASLAGNVFFDANNDGSRTGDTGIGGVTITLTGTNDLGQSVTLTTTTAADGSYKFDDLRPGTYSVNEGTVPAPYLDGKDTAGTVGGVTSGVAGNDVVNTVVLKSGDASIENNFGEIVPGTISGTVYHDVNNDGSNAGETGIPGTTVTLTGTNDLGQPVSVTTTTDANGNYSFDGLRPGSYTVSETQPAGYLDGKDTAGTNGAAVTANDGISVTLGAGQSSTSNNFGEVKAASLAGNVFFDANNDGSRTGDTGIGGVTITLTGTNDLGQSVTLTTTTAADGSYKFDDLRPGTYSVNEGTVPAPYLDGKDTAGTVGGVTSGVAGNDVVNTVVLKSGDASIENNFGEIVPGTISGTVYHDVNNDGSNAGETGIPGTTVTLTGTNDLGQPVSVTTTTDANGNYSFDGLRPGSYTVSETQPAGYLDGKDTAGTNGAAVTANDGISVTLGAGQSSTSNNFGEVKAASLAGNVFFDANNDGSRTGDTGIGGVTITLTGTNDLGQSVTLTTTTAADGSYKFDDLRPGTYSVNEGTVPAPYLDGKDTAGTVGGVTSGVAGNDVVNTVVLKSGDASIENNFGEIVPGTISGTVYHDVNNDGSNAGETGIPGTTVTLTGTNDLGQPVSVTTTTDANGNYSFDGLRPGSYTVSETQPAGYLDGKDTAGTNGAAVTANDGISVTLGAGQSSTSNNFGEVKAASLTGYVYQDAGNDGVKGAGEAGIAGVTVTLTGTNDLGQVVSVTATTDANGFYSFANLRPGTYAVAETQPAGFLDGKDTAGTTGGTVSNDLLSAIVLKSGDASSNNNFGELKGASIAGTVYHDVNNDGSNAGEAGIPGTTVKLTGTDDLGNAVSVTTTTDANGNYSFTGLRPGSYTVAETTPAGYLDGKDTAGTNGAAVTANDTIAVTLGNGQSSVSNNFGEVKAASLTGYVYQDAGNDGVKGAGEAGIAGVTVTLTGTNDLGQVVSVTATTDANGFYSFANLRPGTYAVAETQPAGFLDGKDTAGTTGGTVSNDLLSAIVLKSGDASSNNNFGELKGASIAGTVYHDVNNDGSNAGEAGIPGTTVKLTGTDDLGNAVSVTTTTDANGNYSFTGLRPGSYTVAETTPAGYLDGKDTAGTNGAAVTANDTIAVTLGNGQSSVSNNFGEVKAASLTGYVYQDAGNDGVKGAGEAGIAGVTVTLTGTNDLGQVVSVTATTDANGFYSFANLRPGTYAVAETQPAGFLDGKDTAGTTGGTVSNDLLSAIVLKSGDASSNNNFGELKGASIAGTVYHDVNNDGSNAGEAGIPGTTVKLTGTDDLGNAVSVTTTTDANGNYSFTGLRPGSYTVAETTPAGYLDGKDTAGTNGAAVTANDTIAVTLGNGQSSVNNNFGEVKAASLAGYVYFDANDDGARTGEAGIPGATVTLTGTNDLGQPVTLTTTTDANGAYNFSNLRPGTYTVTETQPAGYIDGKDTAGSTGGTVTNDVISAIVLKSGDASVENNFGEKVCLVDIGDKVWLDADKDGLQDAGEKGVAGISVTLIGAGADGALGTADDTTRSTTTDANGNYLFQDVAHGTYKVRFDAPSSLYSYTTANVGSNDAIDSDVVATLVKGSTNLIVNGSFENPVTGYGQFASIAGWTGNGDKIEVGTASGYGVTGATGNQVVEVDANNCAVGGLYQDVATTAGQTYQLSVDVAQRAGVAASTNTVDVYWAGTKIATIDPTSTALSTYSFTVKGTGGNDRLEFKEQSADDDSVGGIIDNVRLVTCATVYETAPITINTCADNLTIDAGLTANFKTGIDVEKYVSGTTCTYTQNTGGEGADCSYWKSACTTTSSQSWVSTGWYSGYWQTVTTPTGWSGITGCKGTESFNSIFGVSCTGGDKSIYQILCGTGTTALDKLMRECVTAYLNSCHDKVDYSYTKDQVCAQVKYALSCGKYDEVCALFKNENEQGCNWNTGKSSYTCTVDTKLYDADTPPGLEVTTGSTVTFTYVVKNTGDVALANVALVDDRIANVTYISGDTDKDGLLDTNETWTYTATEVAQAGTIKNIGTVTAVDAITKSIGVSDNDPAYYTGVGSTVAKASLGDKVWYDCNANGVQDSGEVGLAGVKVTLTGAGTDGTFGTADDITATTTTASNGQYLFKDLVAGKYTVNFDGPTGYAFTKADHGGNDAKDSDANVSTGTTGVITLTAGEQNLSVDAGLTKVGIDVEKYVSGNLVTSSNNCGGEGASVSWWKSCRVWDSSLNDYSWAGTGCKSSTTFNQLFGVNCTGGTQSIWQVLCGTGTTALDKMMRECVSAYLNACHDKVDYSYTKDQVCAQVKYAIGCGKYDETCNAFSSQNERGCDWTTTKTSYTSTVDTKLYDADTPPGLEVTTGSTVTFTYLVKNTGDTALKNVVLTDDRISTVTYVSGDTDADGQLDTNETWTYTAKEAASAGTIKNIGTVTAVDALSGTESVTDKDAAYYTGVNSTAAKGAIGDRVWEDCNFNGIQDAGEGGLSGVKVTLKGAGTDGSFGTADDITAVTYTGSNGAYAFKDLAAGKYQVVFGDGSSSATTGWYVTKQNQGTNDAKDSDIDATGTTGVITLAAGEQNMTVDAGAYRKASVGDKVWEDADHDNVQDAGEKGIGGITVKLMDSTGTTVLATTTTNSSGNYLFSNLDPGAYVLQFDKTNVSYYSSTWGGTYNLSTWKWAKKDIGSNDGIDSDVAGDAVATTNVSKTSAFTLVSGQSDMSKDAGITPIVIDLNGDGIQTVARSASDATFDLFGNGSAVKSGWISGSDGFLAVDSNGNGKIDDITELFGGTTKGAGFAQLASYDSNSDGQVNADDAAFADLRIWQDANGNHQTDDGELVTLAQAGVAALTVGYTELPFLDAQGNLHLERSTATLADGSSTDMTDVYFNVAAEDALAAGVSLPTIADLLGDDRSLDGVLGASAAVPVALASAQACASGCGAGDASEVLRKLAGLSQEQCQQTSAA